MRLNALLVLLTAATVTLKLTGVVAWSWLWVLAPLWVLPAIVVAFVGGLLAFVLLACIIVLPFALLKEMF